MKCQICKRELLTEEAVYRVAIGHGDDWFTLFHGSIGSVCTECARPIAGRKWFVKRVLELPTVDLFGPRPEEPALRLLLYRMPTSCIICATTKTDEAKTLRDLRSKFHAAIILHPSLFDGVPSRGIQKGTSTVTSLLLKRAPIGWNQDDFEVLEDGKVVGRIFCLDAVGPQARQCGPADNWRHRRLVPGGRPESF